MGGIGGFTGVVPTLWCTLCGFDKHAQRAVIQNFNLSMLAVTMLTYLGTGMITRDMLPMFAVVAPAMLVPTLLGTRLYMGISELAFRRIVLGLLTCSGVTLLISAVPQLLARGHAAPRGIASVLPRRYARTKSPLAAMASLQILAIPTGIAAVCA